jgi:hypothetical protein
MESVDPVAHERSAATFFMSDEQSSQINESNLAFFPRSCNEFPLSNKPNLFGLIVYGADFPAFKRKFRTGRQGISERITANLD